MRWLLPAFAEDVTRVLEMEVRDIQKHVLTIHPEAAYVEIIPDSSQSSRIALEALTSRISKFAEISQVGFVA